MGLLYTIFSEYKPNDFFIAFSAITCLYLVYFYYKHFTRINPLPGPLPIPIIGSFAIFKADIDAWFYELNKVYGHNGVFELNIAGNRQIVFTRAEYIEKFMLSSVDTHLMRTANNGLLDLFDLETKGVGLNHNYKYWKFNRQIFSQAVMPMAYSPKTSKFVNHLFEEMAGYWIDMIQKDGKDAGKATVNMATWMRRFTCDFISLLTTGEPSHTIRSYYRTLKNENITKDVIECEEFIRSINTFVSDNQIMFVPKSIKDLPLIKGRVKKLLDNNYFFYGRLVDIVKKRRKEIEKATANLDKNGVEEYFKSKQLDLLTYSILVNTQYDKDARNRRNVDPSLLRPMTDDEIRGMMFDAFIAGTDTTVNTLCYAIYYISHHPEVKKKLLEEIKSVFSDDPNRQVTLSDLEKLKYCEAVIKETSRIRPAVTMISRFSSHPDEIAGYKWPSNMLFIMYSRGLNNNPLYWKDPGKFMPERFYETEEIKKQHKNSFLVFGGGPRICPGRKLAMVGLKTQLTLLYRKFDVELEDMKAPLKVETSTITICKELKIKVTPRE